MMSETQEKILVTRAEENLSSYCQGIKAKSAFAEHRHGRGGPMHVFYFVAELDANRARNERLVLLQNEDFQEKWGKLCDIIFVDTEEVVPVQAKEFYRKPEGSNGEVKKEGFIFHGPVIGLWGPARSGKDTVCDIVQEMRKHTDRIAFAEPFKKFCQEIFDFSHEQLWGADKDKPDHRYVRVCEEGVGQGARTYLTPRMALQSLGSEWGRRLYKDVWVDYCFRRINSGFDNVQIKQPEDGHHFMSSWVPRQTRMFLISDVRTRGEFEAVVRSGGHLVAISRENRKWEATEEVAKHSTESVFEDHDLLEQAHYRLDNDGTLEDLRGAVGKMLGEFGL
jgi:hypothetical protein